MPQGLHLFQLQKLLPDLGEGLVLRERCGSTNDEAKDWLRAKERLPALILTNHQEAGRGRRGHQWLSDPELSLTMSLVEKNEWKSSWLAIAAGYAVMKVMHTYGVKAQVKWPNDVWVGSAKLAGVLVEDVNGASIIGIGLNLGKLPVNQPFEATSMEEHGARIDSREHLITDIYLEWKRVTSRAHPHQIVEDLWAHLLWADQEVLVTRDGDTRVEGFFKGLSAEGAAVVQTKTELVQVTDVSRMRLKS